MASEDEDRETEGGGEMKQPVSPWVIGGGLCCGVPLALFLVVGLVWNFSGPKQTNAGIVPPGPAGAMESTFKPVKLFKAVYKVIERTDVSALGVARMRVRVVVPDGLSRSELDGNLTQAACDEANRSKAKAVMVFGYRKGTDTSGEYTAGRSVWAPYGDWGQARADVPREVYEAVVDHSEGYHFAKGRN